MKKLASEKVILASPLSFVGSAARIWRLTHLVTNPWLKWLAVVPATLALTFGAWCFVLMWYSIFGILLVPWRLFRRSQRKSKRQALQHQEMLQAIKESSR